MSLEDYNAIEETLYLLSSRKNAQRLYKSLDELKQGKYQEHDLSENVSSHLS
jgi:antitoxin YefM